MDKNSISRVAIYPPLGIARVGNSDEYFMASDVPGVAPDPPGGYKDGDNRVKKQVVRFRVYAFDKDGKVLGELTHKDAVQIEWRVHVANVKAAWYQFNNALDLPDRGISSLYRNSSVTGNDRQQMVIDPGSRTISGLNQQGSEYQLDGGKFFGTEVPLGELRTDEQGRLLYFGGDGHSASLNNAPAVTFANNDGWHDDTSDGVIRATVTVNGQTFDATPAMVAVTPPDFGPGLYGVVTMNDVVQNLFINEMNYPDPAADGVVFYRDIYPMLQRMTNTQWVNEGFFMLFGKNSPSDFTDPDYLAQLASTSEANKAARMRVFNWFRNPDNAEDTATEIPPFYGDGFGEYYNTALDNLPITQTQYARLKKWANGDFKTGKPEEPKSFEEMSAEEQINALNQAPFEECLGGPFHPGIEITWPMRVKLMWEEPYRLKTVKEGESTQLDFGPLLTSEIALSANGPLSKSGPGALTRWLGVPWQTDEASCLSGYNTTYYLPLPSFWAARVPNQVMSEESYQRMQDEKLNLPQRLKHFDYRQDWLRDFGTVYQKKINYMVQRWHDLGIIAQDSSDTKGSDNYLPQQVWKETGRNFDPLSDPTFEQVLIAEGVKEPQTEPLLKAAIAVEEKSGEAKKVKKDSIRRQQRTFGRGEL